ncbi:MAG: RNA polymerase factor sigma-54 [Prevotellaceae bacterium]|nr:RNA polymerase factor sigma-54 [Prevotellaceae bacterium]
MAQGSRQIQTQVQQQVQTLSPQQVLVVRLLELPEVAVEERVRSELLENPALEEGKESEENEEFDDDAAGGETTAEGAGSEAYNELDDYKSEDDIPDYKLQEHNRSQGGRAEEIPFSQQASFYETLTDQLGERDLDGKQRELAEYIVGSLDDDGLLRKSLQSIGDELAIYSGIDATRKELEAALRVVQDFDPAGVGARDLQECLLIQVRRKLKSQPSPSPLLRVEERILTECYDEFARKRWDKIADKLGLTQAQTLEAIRDICKLNPRPGIALGETLDNNMQHIIPDFLVESGQDGSLQVTLNDRNLPELRMNRDYTRLLEEQAKRPQGPSKEAKEATLFLKQKLDAAQGFINALKQRQQTLLATMEGIVKLQRAFFLEGDESLLRPMILKDVAEQTGLDLSTISRVAGGKYVQTDYGVYPLKFFFSDAYTTDGGEEMSVREIRRILKECIDGEDKKHPYTDDEIAVLLKEKGYPMARRTVAKYRQQLHIPVARLRK